MRLLFNATNLRSEGGVILMEQLLGELLAYQTPAAPAESVQLLLYHNPELNARIQAMMQTLPAEAQVRVEPIPLREPDGLRRFYWEQITLPRLIREQKVDTLLSFGNTGPLFPGCRQILYLQQSIPYSNYRPQRHTLQWIKFQVLYGFLINLAQWGSERIIVPTSWLIEPMRRALGYLKPAQAYRATLPGIPPWPNVKPEEFSALDKEMLQQLSHWKEAGGKILLYPCYLAPYKNIPALLAAIQRVKSATPFKLVLTFNADSKEYFPCKADVLAAVAKCDRKQVMLTGALSRPLLAQVYALTDILIFPSLVETLGLPLLEAMSQGIPIVALDGNSESTKSTQAAFAREICQDAALYAPPNHAQALAAQIQRLLQDSALAATLSQSGLKRAAQLSWADHAQQILAPSLGSNFISE